MLITGPQQEWTPSRGLKEVRPAATSGKPQFTESPPERREVTFGVRSAADGLQVLLYTELSPSETLLTVDAEGWRVHRTHPVLEDELVDSGTHPPGSVLAADDWVTYSVSVDLRAAAVRSPEAGVSTELRLHRLYGNGTRALWLEVRYTAPLPVDTVKVRAVKSDSNCAGRRHDNGGWNLWTFDKLYQNGMEVRMLSRHSRLRIW